MIAIVTDSTAYLTHDEAVELGVVVVPMSYSLDGVSSLNEGCIENDDAAERQVAEHMNSVHTSQATLAGFVNTFTMLKRAGYETLCLTISSRLSGTYANAVLAAKELGGQHIEVVDSLTTCAGLSARGGGPGAHPRGDRSRASQHLNKIKNRSACFPRRDMTRFAGAAGSETSRCISTVLNIRPLLELKDGSIVSAGIARGKLDQARKLCGFCEKATGTLIVNGFLADEAAAKLTAQLARGDRSIERRRVGPVLGAHLGAGCVGVAWIEP